MAKKNPSVDAYIAKAQPFARPVLKYIRKNVHAGCPDVEEALKWSFPAFMYKGILCGMAAFKEHCTFGFWKHSLLEKGGKKVDDAMGQFGRITSVDDLPKEKQFIALVKKAAELNDKGIKVERVVKKRAPIPEPDYFLAALKKNKKALASYGAFPPSHKREYLEWITEAKSEDTRNRRLTQAIEWISEGKGRNWKYERP